MVDTRVQPLLDCACHTGGAYRPPCAIPGGCGSAGCGCNGQPPAADCLSCGRRNPRPARVCEHCRTKPVGWLGDLPGLVRRLELEMVPTQAVGERVSSSSPHSTPAARLAAMNLRVSSAVLDAPHPWWYLPPGDLDPGDAVDGLVQVGMPSIPSWVRGWAREWRTRHGHATHLREAPLYRRAVEEEIPARPPRPPRPEEPLTGATEGGPWGDYVRALTRWRDDMGAWRRRVDVVAWQQRRDEAAEEGARVVLGLGEALPLPDRPDDPLDEQWDTRHGTPVEHYALGRDAGYLATWLPAACDDEDRHPDIGEFLRGLRTLHKVATVVLEGRSVDKYVGRCPEPRYDREANETVPCGTDLWTDPYVSHVACARCKAETRRLDFLHLRARQLDIWSEAELSEPASLRARKAAAR